MRLQDQSSSGVKLIRPSVLFRFVFLFCPVFYTAAFILIFVTLLTHATSRHPFSGDSCCLDISTDGAHEEQHDGYRGVAKDGEFSGGSAARLGQTASSPVLYVLQASCTIVIVHRLYILTDISKTRPLFLSGMQRLPTSCCRRSTLF